MRKVLLSLFILALLSGGPVGADADTVLYSHEFNTGIVGWPYSSGWLDLGALWIQPRAIFGWPAGQAGTYHYFHADPSWIADIDSDRFTVRLRYRYMVQNAPGQDARMEFQHVVEPPATVLRRETFPFRDTDGQWQEVDATFTLEPGTRQLYMGFYVALTTATTFEQFPVYFVDWIIVERVDGATSAEILRSTGNPRVHVTPSPFNPSCAVTFSAPIGERAIVQVFDVRGRLVELLFDGVVTAAEQHVGWDAPVTATGVYYVRVTSDGKSASARAVLVK